MAYTQVKEISDFLKNKDIKDIALAIMNIEQNSNQNLTKNLYIRYSIQYDHYFYNHEELTGILNTVLQDKGYKIVPFEDNVPEDYKETKFIKE